MVIVAYSFMPGLMLDNFYPIYISARYLILHPAQHRLAACFEPDCWPVNPLRDDLPIAVRRSCCDSTSPPLSKSEDHIPSVITNPVQPSKFQAILPCHSISMTYAHSWQMLVQKCKVLRHIVSLPDTENRAVVTVKFLYLGKHPLCKPPSHSAPQPYLFDRALLPERPQQRQCLLADRLSQSDVSRVETFCLNDPAGNCIRTQQCAVCGSERVHDQQRQLIPGKVLGAHRCASA
jgi:hypothetical protein